MKKKSLLVLIVLMSMLNGYLVGVSFIYSQLADKFDEATAMIKDLNERPCAY